MDLQPRKEIARLELIGAPSVNATPGAALLSARVEHPFTRIP